MDLADLDTLPHKIDRLLAHHNAPRRGLNLRRSTAASSRSSPRWRQNCCPTPRRCGGCSTSNAARASASCSRARKARAGRGSRHLPLRHLVQYGGGAGGDRHRQGPRRGRLCARHLQGLYDPRGEGPFPTELSNEIGEEIGRRGKEFGVNTGRKRRCGWFDAVLVRQTVRTCGIAGLALTKLDILDGFDTIEVCTGYMLDGKEIDHLPAGEGAQARVVPIYETIEGWKEPTANARSYGPAGPGDQICASGRGTRGLSDCITFHQPRTRGYYSGTEPVRGLTRCYRQDFKNRAAVLMKMVLLPAHRTRIAGLDPNAPGESRRALYERARTALIAQLRSVQPPLPNRNHPRAAIAGRSRAQGRIGSRPARP